MCARILDSTNCQWTLKSSRHCCWTFTSLNMNILEEFLSVKYCISNRTKHMHALHTYYNVQRYSWVQLRHSFSCSPMKWCTNSFFFFFLSMSFILSNCWMLNSWYTFTLLCGPWYRSAHIYFVYVLIQRNGSENERMREIEWNTKMKLECVDELQTTPRYWICYYFVDAIHI